MSGEDEYVFQLVQFRQSAKKGILDIDIVPSTWLSWDNTKEVCIIQYPPPPYNAKTCMQLQRLVEEQKLPPKKWPVWEVDIKGGADTYDTAISRIERLRTAKFAFTTDTETDGKEKSNRATKRLKKKTITELFDLSEETVKNDDSWHPGKLSMDEKNSTSDSLSSEGSPKKKTKFLKTAQKKSNIKKESRQSVSSGSFQELPHKVTSAVQHANSDTNNNKSLSEVRSSSINLLPSTADSADNLSVASVSVSASVLKDKEFDGKNCGKPSRPNSTNAAIDVTSEKNKCDNRTKTLYETSGKGLSNDTIFLVSVLKGLSIDIQAQTAAINALHDALKQKQIIATTATVQNFEQEFGVTLPFKTLRDFEEFEELLKGNKKFHDGFTAALNQLLDRNNNMSKSITSILRKFFVREVIMGFTAKKKIDGKTLLKTTQFGISLIATLTRFHTRRDGTPVDTHEVLTRAGNGISNAKDWDGRDRTAKSQ